MSTEKKVIQVFKNVAGRSAANGCGMDTTVSELGLDSFDRICVMMELEDVFSIDIEDADAQAIETVAEAVALVEKKLAKSEGAQR